VVFERLYVRIWLAVVLTVAVLTILLGWAWQLTAEAPLREVVMHDSSGQVVGKGHMRMGHRHPRDQEDGEADAHHEEALEQPAFGPRGHFGNGPEFVVHMQNGQTVLMHLPRPAKSPWIRPPFGFFWTLGLVAVAVALATYPIVRKLTRRLELLQNGVQKWGAGDLSSRLPEEGHDEVAFLAARFNDAAQRIETLVKSHEQLLASQKSLLANASHELRSPLTRIRMGLELLETPTAPAFKTEIAQNIAELDLLIEEILLSSRLDAKEANLGSLESVDLIGMAAEECARVTAELTVELPTKPQPHPTLHSDTTAPLCVQGVTKLLRRAMRNLLENARRHGAGEIQMTLRRDDNNAILCVCDKGPGVPPELSARIFEPFYRLPGASEKDGGVGLGLALVKSIARRHGGSVTCQNHPTGGACFTLTLPLEPGFTQNTNDSVA
jgi:signal transduction histidine kinase